MAGPTPFEVLGVPFDVDDATLKKAYFRKVREFPPETHAKEFQQLTEAFELLRVPDQRRAVAERLQQGGLPPELEALLTQVDAASRERDRPRVIELLKTVVERFPAFEPACVMLIRNLLEGQATTEALRYATALVQRNARSLTALLLLAEIQMGSYEYVAAREAIAKAAALDANDRRPPMLEAMMLAQMEKHDEALAKLDDVLKLPDQRFVPDAQVIGHRVLLQTERGQADAMHQELDRIVKGAGDEKPRAASLLVQLAGIVLANERPHLAREILERAWGLAPDRPRLDVGAPRELAVSALPEPTQRVVNENRQRPPQHVVVIPASRRTGALALFFGSIALLALTGFLFVNTGEGSLICMFMFLAGGGVIAGRELLRRSRGAGTGGGADYLEVRGFHLVEIMGKKARIIPLLSIVGIREDFGKATLLFEQGVEPVELDGSDPLFGILRAAAAQRSRLISLMTSDLIETEQEREPLEWSAPPAARAAAAR